MKIIYFFMSVGIFTIFNNVIDLVYLNYFGEINSDYIGGSLGAGFIFVFLAIIIFAIKKDITIKVRWQNKQIKD